MAARTIRDEDIRVISAREAIKKGRSNMAARTMTDAELDEYFDNGGDITEFIAEESIVFPGLDEAPHKFSITMPEWMIAELDATAKHLAVSRQAVINM